VQAAGLVHPGDRAAARPDLDDLDDRGLDRVAGTRRGSLDVMEGLDRHATAADRRGLGRRTADVEGEHVLDAEPPAELRRSGYAGDRPGLQQRDGRLGRALERGDAAARPHRVQGRLEACVPKSRSQIPEIGGDRWLHVGREHGRAGPFEFAPLRADLVRGDDLDVAQELRQEPGGATLMLGVRPRVEEADCDGLDVEVAQALGDGLQPGLVERLEYRAGV
jgi:hypothetical protein